jgi:peptidoglycan hydrolase-like protein with peptidoglycan-binding domain
MGTHGSNPPAPCVFILRPLKAGDVGADVINLQNFLKNTEGISVKVTGTFDAQTVEAVKAFQTKYSSEILAPWGITLPTGSVYMTTLKKINSRVCGGALSLTPAELAEITSYKARVQNGTTFSGSVEVGSAGSNPGTKASTTSGTATNTENNQVGAVAKTSVATKVWNFIKRLFGR